MVIIIRTLQLLNTKSLKRILLEFLQIPKKGEIHKAEDLRKFSQFLNEY